MENLPLILTSGDLGLGRKDLGNTIGWCASFADYFLV